MAAVAQGDVAAVTASRSWPQCQAISPADGDGIDMYSYMATGGSTDPGPLHSVTVSDDMMMIESGMGGSGGKGNGFGLKTDDMGVDWLSGRPNLKAGDYMFTLNASDNAAQPPMESVSWKLRVEGDPYDGPPDTTGPEPDGIEATADVDDDAWGSFISSITYTPEAFSSATEQTAVTANDDQGGLIPGLDLADETTATISGRMDADDDIDVFWVGGLTPNSVLDLMIEGATETGTGITNEVFVRVYRYLPGEPIMPGARTEIMGGASDDFDAKYENLACGYYYFEVDRRSRWLHLDLGVRHQRLDRFPRNSRDSSLEQAHGAFRAVGLFFACTRLAAPRKP